VTHEKPNASQATPTWENSCKAKASNAYMKRNSPISPFPFFLLKS
jgi:hypothetical protein